MGLTILTALAEKEQAFPANATEALHPSRQNVNVSLVTYQSPAKGSSDPSGKSVGPSQAQSEGEDAGELSSQLPTVLLQIFPKNPPMPCNTGVAPTIAVPGSIPGPATAISVAQMA